jgi:hypothetical protein
MHEFNTFKGMESDTISKTPKNRFARESIQIVRRRGEWYDICPAR